MLFKSQFHILAMPFVKKIVIYTFKNVCIKHSQKFCSLAQNRTGIWSFGNAYTIHCTTRPFIINPGVQK